MSNYVIIGFFIALAIFMFVMLAGGDDGSVLSIMKEQSNQMVTTENQIP